jgi:hypothetical protein
MKILASTLSLVVLIAISGACDQASPTAPRAAPAAPPGPDLRFTFTVSGVVRAVTSAGLVPLDGAKLLITGTSIRLTTTSDAGGRYSVSGVFDGIQTISASKEGYEPKTIIVTTTGDTQLDIQIVRIPTHTLSGVVSQMTPAGRVPLEGVRVHWSEMHLDATTNAAGFYSLDVPRGQSLLLASKEGYKEKVLTVAVSNDVRVDIELEQQ